MFNVPGAMLGFTPYLTLIKALYIIFLIFQMRKLYISKLFKVTEQPNQNLGCPTPGTTHSATRRCNVQ